MKNRELDQKPIAIILCQSGASKEKIHIQPEAAYLLGRGKI
jgi:hypothetical protein